MSTKQINGIRHEEGFAYIAVPRRPGLSSHEHPSQARVLEDGIPLPGPANSLHADIRRLGGGRYSFWHNEVYFSTADNSDPRTNGRIYAIAYKPRMLAGMKSLIPHSLFCGGERAWNRLAAPFRKEQRRQALWGLFYWLCFLSVLWRGQRSKTSKGSHR
jgi:hypothetical protein